MNNTVNRHDKEDHWISVSDLMAGLMLLFLLIVLVKMKNISDKTKEFEYVTQALEETKDLKKQELIEYELIKVIISKFIQDKEKLYQSLKTEFKDDLPQWGAVLDRETLSIIFNEPDVLFHKGKYDLRPRYKQILQDFFPRYLRILQAHEHIIDEVQLQGHTSSEWTQNASKYTAYFKNMGLSQARTRAVLEYVAMLPDVRPHWEWTKKYITANGLSSSRLIMKNTQQIFETYSHQQGQNQSDTLDIKSHDGKIVALPTITQKGLPQEDAEKSRRVEFRITTKDYEIINRVRNLSK